MPMTKQLVALFVFLLAAVPGMAQSPDPLMLNKARGDVGYVIATDCTDGNDRSGTAFVWPTADQVVTARHVVAGCRTVFVQFRDHGRFKAEPLREIRSQDIIALQLDSQAGATVQNLSELAPQVHSQVAVVGFALGAPTADDKLLTVTTGNIPPPARLRELLPNAERQLIQNNGPWDLDTAIIRLDGNLTHGHSGAPLFDHQGRVVAIGAGGLQNGATGIVWAVSASYLMEPENWTSIGSGHDISPESALTFAVQPPQTQLEQVSCGNFTLSRSRTSSFQGIAATIDDRPGLSKVMAYVGAGLSINFDAMQFDVWEDLRAGTVIPLPAGTTLVQGQAGCTIFVGHGVSIWIRSISGSPQSIQDFSIQFEADIAAQLGPLSFDPEFTYPYPINRADGFRAQRTGGVGQQWMVDAVRGFSNYGFITHVGRADYYLGVSALRQESIFNFNLVAQCQQFGTPSACSVVMPPLYDWAIAALSVHMTTMPPI